MIGTRAPLSELQSTPRAHAGGGSPAPHAGWSSLPYAAVLILAPGKVIDGPPPAHPDANRSGLPRRSAPSAAA
jgi:hypothetical protein